jgi:hypothetical protein
LLISCCLVSYHCFFLVQKQETSPEKQTSYQCRCSFLEVISAAMFWIQPNIWLPGFTTETRTQYLSCRYLMSRSMTCWIHLSVTFRYYPFTRKLHSSLQLYCFMRITYSSPFL